MHVLESDAVHGALAERKYCAQVNQAVVAAGLVDGTSESVRESEVKVALQREHITGFIPQVDMYSAAGKWSGRVDFLDPDNSVALEYDGRGKMQAEFGIAPERARERGLVSAGLRPVRIMAETFATGEWLVSLRQAIEANRGRVFPQAQWRKK